MKNVCLFLILIVSFSCNVNKEEVYHPENNNITVFNNTKYTNIDNYVYCLSDYILLDSANIHVNYISKFLNSKDIEYYGYIENPFPYTYQIFLHKNLSNLKLKQTLSHEFVHLWQYHYNILRKINNNLYIYYNDTINVRKVKYFDRPFEKDAFYYSERLLDVLP